MTSLEILIAAKKLIDSPNRWCQDVSSLPGYNGRPERYCSTGAVYQILYGDNHIDWLYADQGVKKPYIDAIAALNAVLGNYPSLYGDAGNVVEFNDSHTHAEVMALWDKAIERLKALAPAQVEEVREEELVCA